MENSNFLQMAKYLLKLEKSAYKKCKKIKIKVTDKGFKDLLTTMDTTIEKYLISSLSKDFPGVKIVSEEFNSKVKAEGTYFSVDPVDGTVNFANNLIDLWAIQIAYVENDVTVASAIYLPKFGEYYAAKGVGAFKNGKSFKVQQKSPEHSLVCIDSDSNASDCKIINALDKKVLRFRALGAGCIHSTMTAEGNLGGFVEFDGHSWDLLSGFLLMEEAGCVRKSVFGHHIFANTEELLTIIEDALKETTTERHKRAKWKTKAALPQNIKKK